MLPFLAVDLVLEQGCLQGRANPAGKRHFGDRNQHAAI